jgi:flagellar M-ring protein FliF
MLTRILNQLRAFWERQTPVQKVVLVSVVVIFLVVTVVLISWATTTTYAVAFSGLSEADAGEIVSLLTEQNIPYQIRGTGTILVPSDQVYEVRLSMATQGLPGGDSVGYELFSENLLGMTEFTQRVNYQRALEGELERTISSLDPIEAVRVHIVTPEDALLTSEQAPTTASVTIQQKPSKELDASQVRAITYLVANAVENLEPQNVTVVDTEGNLLASGSGDEGISGGLTQVDDRRSAEHAVANELQKKIKTLLDTTLGSNRSVVQVTVTLDWTEKEVSSQTFNPTPEAVRSEQNLSETYTTDSGVASGIPGVTSNLPDGTTETTTGTESNLVYARTEQTTNYEISSVETTETIYPGEINQISLSVLVDGVTDQQQLSVLENAISAAVGINRDRGDVISVQSLTFDRTYVEQQQDELAQSDKTQTIITIVEIVAVVLIAFFLLWYISRLLRNLKLASVEVWEPVMKPAYQMAGGPSMTSEMPSIIGSLAQAEERMAAEEEKPPAPLPDLAKLVASKKVQQTPEEEQMQRILSRMAEDNPAGVAEIIQMWLSEDKR